MLAKKKNGKNGRYISTYITKNALLNQKMLKIKKIKKVQEFDHIKQAFLLFYMLEHGGSFSKHNLQNPGTI